MKPLQEPLFHFFIIGAVLFGAHALLNRTEDGVEQQRKQIHIGQGEVRWLTETWTLQRQRAPTHEELQGLVAEFLNEELLAREAREMKLDEDDTVIRRRLAQKVTFLIEDTLRRSEPTEAELQQLYEAGAERFRTGARVSFSQIYFNSAARTDPVSDAKSMLADLSGAVAEDASAMGDRSLLASEFYNEDERSVTGMWGPGFARALFALEPGIWSGPVTSGFGIHLVRVSAFENSRVQSFAEVRGRLLDEWRRDQEQVAKKRYFAELQKKYNVVVDEDVKPLLVPATATARAGQ